MTDHTTPRRSDCPISYALDIFGDRWTLLVLRDLFLKGKRHFSDLLRSDEGIASNILTERLKRLERIGLIRREPDPADGRKSVYRATERGISLVPVLVEIAVWGLVDGELDSGPPGFVERHRSDRAGIIAEFEAGLRSAD